MSASRIAALSLLLLSALWAVVFFNRPGLETYAARRAVTPLPTGGPSLTATWYGTAAVVVSDGQSALFLDPFLTRPDGWLRMLGNQAIAPDEAKVAQALQSAGIKKLDAVLVSHSHHDHAMDAGVVARLTGAVLAGSASTLNIGRGSAVAESQLTLARPGEALKFGAFTVTFMDSTHAGATGGVPNGEIVSPLVPPARYLDYKQGGTYSIFIEHAIGNLLFQGSAGFVPGALKARRADVVLLGIAFASDLEPYLQETVDAVGATRVLPIHWDDFTRSPPPIPSPIGVNLPAFFEHMARERPSVRVQTFEWGKPVVLFPAD